MGLDKEKQRARWRRNKHAERKRGRPRPAFVDPWFQEVAELERDRREATAYPGARCWPEFNYLFGDRLDRAISLAADVWLAVTCYEAQHGPGSATTARICRWLKAAGRTNGYTPGSLRKLTPKARDRILLLETTNADFGQRVPYWTQFVP